MDNNEKTSTEVADESVGSVLARLREPFAASDVEWRLVKSGVKGSGFWALAVVYVTNRAIMDRLDEVVGPENWRNEYVEGGGGYLCGISIRVNGEWVTKWDGAGHMAASSSDGGLSESDANKGTLSTSMKRAAVQWGIGRYLYRIPEGWAKCYEDTNRGRFRARTRERKDFSWDPPDLPEWALPAGDESEAGGESSEAPDAVVTEGQIADLEALIKEVGANRARFLKFLNVEAITDLTAKKYAEAVAALEEKRARVA